MPANVKELAGHTLAAAYFAQAEFAVRADVGTWSPELVQEWIDYLIAQAADPHKLRIKGVRASNAGFAKLGIERDTMNSGTYKDVPVVITPIVDFDDVVEVVFVPAA
jgi:hypothetical protein